MVVLLGRHLQQVSSRSRYAKLSRTNDAFNHGGQALAVADPVHQLNSFLWIVKLRLRFFDSSILEHWALQFSSSAIVVFFFPPTPHPSHFFSLGLLFGCKSLFDCLFFPSSHFQAIHSFSSSRGIVKSAFVFFFRTREVVVFCLNSRGRREVVEFRVKLRGRSGFRLGFLRLVCVFLSSPSSSI